MKLWITRSGGIKRGRAELKHVYELIFKGSEKVDIEDCDYTIHETAEMSYAVGRERGYFGCCSEKIKLAIRTSRIYQKINGSWKQVYGHCSIDNPELLKIYQLAVPGKTVS